MKLNEKVSSPDRFHPLAAPEAPVEDLCNFIDKLHVVDVREAALLAQVEVT